MNTPPLEYAGPATPKHTPKPSPWLVAGATLALLVLLWQLANPPVIGVRGRQGELAAAKTDLSNLDGALDLFKQDVARLPTQAEGLNALAARPADAERWAGPYLKTGAPKDPWGNAYIYRVTPSHAETPYVLLSPSPDGKVGTPDDLDTLPSPGADRPAHPSR